jgi:hypothetical protein
MNTKAQFMKNASLNVSGSSNDWDAYREGELVIVGRARQSSARRSQSPSYGAHGVARPTFQFMDGLRCLLIIAVVTFQITALAQSFSSGSDGSMGALNVTSNRTLALPSDGIFRFTTINIAVGTTLTFTPNAMNTPVYLLATGDVTIDGTIDVSGSSGTTVSGGRGGPGGFDGGPTRSGWLVSRRWQRTRGRERRRDGIWRAGRGCGFLPEHPTRFEYE